MPFDQIWQSEFYQTLLKWLWGWLCLSAVNLSERTNWDVNKDDSNDDDDKDYNNDKDDNNDKVDNVKDDDDKDYNNKNDDDDKDDNVRKETEYGNRKGSSLMLYWKAHFDSETIGGKRLRGIYLKAS